ncbi:MAG: DUF3365 domain-containing protein [bacterium]|nr:DUF3365 domain-containing protein [bacterium]
MKIDWLICLGMVGGLLCLANDSRVLGNEPSPVDVVSDSAQNADSNRAEEGYSIDVARDRAKVLHEVYAATLEVLHERYFHGSRAVVPARAMQDVFKAIREESKIEAGWISVNMKPMSIDHEPKTKFEKHAAKEIASGKRFVEEVDAGFYRSAGAIPLGNGCVGCHGGFFKDAAKKPKFAGLVISIPIIGSKAGDSE